MELLDRYLAAVRVNLPASRAEDITAELHSELLEHIETKETALGRPLDQAEICSILRAFGRPLVVAARYRDRQHLIGPEVYPFYLQALRIVAVVALAVFLLSALLPFLTGNGNLVRLFTRGMQQTEHALLLAFAIVTLLFAVLERTDAPRAWIRNWRPELLPEKTQPKKNSWEAPFSVGTHLFLLLWILGAIPIAANYTGNGLRIELGAIWPQFYWPILALVIARLVLILADWLRPVALRWRALFSIVLALGELAVISALLSRSPLATVVATTATAAQASVASMGINSAIRIALIIAFIVAVARLVAGAYRLVMGR